MFDPRLPRGWRGGCAPPRLAGGALHGPAGPPAVAARSTDRLLGQLTRRPGADGSKLLGVLIHMCEHETLPIPQPEVETFDRRVPLRRIVAFIQSESVGKVCSGFLDVNDHWQNPYVDGKKGALSRYFAR